MRQTIGFIIEHKVAADKLASLAENRFKLAFFLSRSLTGKLKSPIKAPFILIAQANTQGCTPFGPSALKDCLTVGGGHAFAKTMPPFAYQPAGLISPFHNQLPFLVPR